jgi:hypothetical protein
MKLMTKELLRKIPPLYSQENEKDPVVVCKFFMPDGGWTWYVIEGSTREGNCCGWGENCNHKPLTEYDPVRHDIIFFGYVDGLELEFGNFTLSELEAVRGRLGLPVERDRWFEPCRVSKLEDIRRG